MPQTSSSSKPQGLSPTALRQKAEAVEMKIETRNAVLLAPCARDPRARSRQKPRAQQMPRHRQRRRPRTLRLGLFVCLSHYQDGLRGSRSRSHSSSHLALKNERRNTGNRMLVSLDAYVLCLNMYVVVVVTTTTTFAHKAWVTVSSSTLMVVIIRPST